MVDLVGERLDEVVVQRQALLLALIILEVEDKIIGKLVPQLALPQILELKKVMLNIFGGGIALVG